jgi:hypothetical protein
MQPTKRVAWFPHGLNHLYITSFWLFYSRFEFTYFEYTGGSRSFVELFVVEALHEDLGRISTSPMLVNL